MLDLAQSLEHAIVDRAEAIGLTPDQYLSQLLAIPRPAHFTSPWQALSPDHSDAGQRAAIQALLSMPKEEIVRRNAASIDLLEARLAETANATLEEIAGANADWEEHMRRMNGHRALTGERPLFSDVAEADI